MSLDEALRRYRTNRFTDADIVACTGLSVRAWRELIRLKSVRTVEERRGPGRGRIRLCDATTLKRAAVIAAMNRAGFSTAVSGQIAYFVPYHTLLYTVCDPLTILFRDTAKNDPATGLPTRRTVPARNWFDPDCQAKQEPDSDWLLEVYEGRFVACTYGAKSASSPAMFGDLRNDGTVFFSWHPSHERSQVIASPIARLAEELLPYYRFADFVADWENPDKFPQELRSLGFQFEKRPADDALRVTGQSVAQDFTFKTTINISLAIKNAIRRYLKLAPALGPA